ncbi:membrane glycoprotein [Tenuivirus oryzalbae]|uniref:Membrane glycoprotein n=1 Tax=Tenuivirus oryzalbae TaxID=3052764 RepID=A0A2H5CMR2_9VIRU|nr:membrane glycoprotein [Tenuivirus oryzalbae]AUH25691.1 membrane glycoprotein [Tenuivirus oryzalbae]
MYICILILPILVLITPSNSRSITKEDWMMSKDADPGKAIIQISCAYRNKPCKQPKLLNGYYIEDGSVCYNHGPINLHETCFSGSYDNKIPVHEIFASFGGTRYVDCKDEIVSKTTLVGFSQTQHTSKVLPINRENGLLVSYPYSEDKAFRGFVYVENITYCTENSTRNVLANDATSLEHPVVCEDGKLFASSAECDIRVSETQLHVPSCSNVKLPVYDDQIEVCQNNFCKNVTCTVSSACVAYNRMDFLSRVKNYECSKTYKYYGYVLTLILIVFICMCGIIVVNILICLKPVFWVIKTVMYALAGLCHKKPKLRMMEIDMAEVRVVDDTGDGLLLSEESHAPNSNVPDIVRQKARRLSNGLIYVPYIFMLIAISLDSANCLCNDLLTSLSDVEVCTGKDCTYSSKLQLTLYNTPQDFCFKSSSDVYKLRISKITINCLSRPLYYTNSYKKSIGKEEWKCTESIRCSTDMSSTIWDKDDSLHYDYCISDFHVFSYCPFYHYNWKRILYTPTSRLACSVKKCTDVQFEINGHLSKNGLVIHEFTGFQAVHEAGILNIGILNYNMQKLPAEYVECDGKAYERKSNDLGSFDKELMGSIQCPTMRDAELLTSKCQTKIEALEDSKIISYEDNDGINKLADTLTEPLRGVVVSEKGISLDSMDILPMSISITSSVKISSILTSRISMNNTNCEIKGVERKLKKTVIKVMTPTRLVLSDVLICKDIASCSLTFNKDDRAECYTTSYKVDGTGEVIQCKFLYSGDSVMCKYDVSPIDIVVVAPKIDLSSFDNVKTTSQTWSTFIMDMIRENPKLTIIASILPIGFFLKTMKKTYLELMDD